MALWAVMTLLGQEGDNFLFPSPGYPVMLGMAKILGMEPRLYNLEKNRNWEANIEQMQRLVDSHTKFILVIDPSNPLGSTWSPEHKKDIIKLCIRKNIALLADEIYESITHEVRVTPFAQLLETDQIDKITVYKCSGLTKMYLGPGWRLGWLITYGSQAVKRSTRKSLRKMFDFIGVPNTIVQAAVPNIINNPKNTDKLNECIGKMQYNRNMLKKGLQSEDYCTVGNSSGSIFSTIVMHLQHFKSGQIGEGIIDFTTYLYAEQNVIVYPGVLFTGEVPFIRVMISCGSQKIQEFLLRFKRFCQKYLDRRQ